MTNLISWAIIIILGVIIGTNVIGFIKDIKEKRKKKTTKNENENEDKI